MYCLCCKTDVHACADSKQYSCRIDGVQFPNHAAAVTHMHDVHKNRIEVLLFDLLQGKPLFLTAPLTSSD